MNSHVFFEGIHQPQQQEAKQNPKYLHNCMVLEIATNWPEVRWIMDRFRNQELKEVDPLERDWLNFILNNKVDVEKYGKDEEKFIAKYFKQPTMKK